MWKITTTAIVTLSFPRLLHNKAASSAFSISSSQVHRHHMGYNDWARTCKYGSVLAPNQREIVETALHLQTSRRSTKRVLAKLSIMQNQVEWSGVTLILGSE